MLMAIAQFIMCEVMIFSGILYLIQSTNMVDLLNNTLSVLIIDQIDNLASNLLYFWLKYSYPMLTQKSDFLVARFSRKTAKASSIVCGVAIVFGITFSFILRYMSTEFLVSFYTWQGPIALGMAFYSLIFLLLSIIVHYCIFRTTS